MKRGFKRRGIYTRHMMSLSRTVSTVTHVDIGRRVSNISSTATHSTATHVNIEHGRSLSSTTSHPPYPPPIPRCGLISPATAAAVVPEAETTPDRRDGSSCPKLYPEDVGLAGGAGLLLS